MKLQGQIQNLIVPTPIHKIVDIYNTPYGRVARTWPRKSKKPPTTEQENHWAKMAHFIEWYKSLPEWWKTSWHSITCDPARSYDDILRRVWWNKPLRDSYRDDFSQPVISTTPTYWAAFRWPSFNRFFIAYDSLITETFWGEQFMYQLILGYRYGSNRELDWQFYKKNCYLGRRKRDSYRPNLSPWKKCIYSAFINWGHHAVPYGRRWHFFEVEPPTTTHRITFTVIWNFHTKEREHSCVFVPPQTLTMSSDFPDHPHPEPW